MKRRELLTLLGGGAIAWPLAARAQQPATPVIGFLHARLSEDTMDQVAAFRSGLAEIGYVEGQNVIIQYRFASGHYDRLPAMAAELARNPIALFVTGSDPAALAAKAATATIPIVFSVGSDPVKLGLVTSFNRPGGNATGLTILTALLEPKRLGLLHQLVPQAASVGLLLNPQYPLAESQSRDVQEAAHAIGLQVYLLPASNDGEIDAAFQTVSERHIAALLVAADPYLDTRRDKIVVLAARHAIPAMYQFREHTASGGLMSYGIDLPDVYRQVGVYAGRILKGARPADLPVMQPAKFEFVINLKTAKALGLDVPLHLQQLADEVIE
jgi:putative ABC transport system substrate-binding protein